MLSLVDVLTGMSGFNVWVPCSLEEGLTHASARLLAAACRILKGFDQIGVDKVIEERLKKINANPSTHGVEDHIKALYIFAAHSGSQAPAQQGAPADAVDTGTRVAAGAASEGAAALQEGRRRAWCPSL